MKPNKNMINRNKIKYWVPVLAPVFLMGTLFHALGLIYGIGLSIGIIILNTFYFGELMNLKNEIEKLKNDKMK